MFSRLFRKKKEPENEYDKEAEEKWYEIKSKAMESILGKEHDIVMHAIIPYQIGGGLDLYYFPNGIEGTGVATKELIDANGKGPSNNSYEAYELVMFTKHELNLDEAKNDETEFGKAHSNINSILNLIARYSEQATLNPNETCEFPKEMDDVGGKCLIFDKYEPSGQSLKIPSKKCGLMVVIEVHRKEMEFAMEQGGARLLNRLKENGYYPYSDLDRPSVV